MLLRKYLQQAAARCSFSRCKEVVGLRQVGSPQGNTRHSVGCTRQQQQGPGTSVCVCVCVCVCVPCSAGMLPQANECKRTDTTTHSEQRQQQQQSKQTKQLHTTTDASVFARRPQLREPPKSRTASFPREGGDPIQRLCELRVLFCVRGSAHSHAQYRV
jgi:hypothetical protein